MAPPSALSTEDKAKVKKTLSSNNKILTATVARVYEARQGETRYVLASCNDLCQIDDTLRQMEIYRCSGMRRFLLG